MSAAGASDDGGATLRRIRGLAGGTLAHDAEIAVRRRAAESRFTATSMPRENIMQRAILIALFAISTAAAVPAAHAKGCLKGAAVGAVAGHVAGHHAVVGAVGGCVVGRHLANKKAAEEKAKAAAPSAPAAPTGPSQETSGAGRS
jgi:hypothetical protein